MRGSLSLNRPCDSGCWVYVSGFRVQGLGLGFRVQDSGFGIWDLWLRVKEPLGFRFWGLRFKVDGSGSGGSSFRVWGPWFSVEGLVFRVQDSGCMVQGPGVGVKGSRFKVWDS